MPERPRDDTSAQSMRLLDDGGAGQAVMERKRGPSRAGEKPCGETRGHRAQAPEADPNERARPSAVGDAQPVLRERDAGPDVRVELRETAHRAQYS